MKIKLLVAFLVILLIIGDYFLLKNDEKKSPKTDNLSTVSNQMPAPDNNNVEEMVVAKEINITAKNWSFDPAEIRVKQGEKVVLKIKSVDVTHGFALPDFDIKVDLKPGMEEAVEFVAAKKGEFTFFCSVICGEGHRDMKGKLIVE